MFLAADLLRHNGDLFFPECTSVARETTYSHQVIGSVVNAKNNTPVCVRLFKPTFGLRERLQTLTQTELKCDAIVEFILYKSTNRWICTHYQPDVILSPLTRRLLTPAVATSSELVDVLYAASNLISCGLASGSLTEDSFVYVAENDTGCAWKIRTFEQLTPLNGREFYHGAYMPPSLRAKLHTTETERVYTTIFVILMIVTMLFTPSYEIDIIHTDEAVFRIFYKISFGLHPHVFPVFCDLMSNAEHLKNTLRRNCTGSKVHSALW
jgi:hypothetical protein